MVCRTDRSECTVLSVLKGNFGMVGGGEIAFH